MLITILIVIIALIGLLVLHELGHFIMAKKLGVKVEEFGVGYPPRLFGKKFGETIYSLNLLPFGAFVRITGEEKRVDDARSFSQKPIWQRMLIILGGVISFWIIAFLIFSLLAGVWGLPTAVSDDFQGKTYLQIIQLAKDSPAEKAGLEAGDILKKIVIPAQATGEDDSQIEVTKISQVQEVSQGNLEKEIVLTLQRGNRIIDISLIPRTSPPEGEGAIGIALARVAKIKSSWYQSPWVGLKMTVEKTVQIPLIFANILKRLLEGERIEGVQLVGPIGLGGFMNQALEVGADNFLMFLGLIAVWLAIFNVLPIPALDGGRFLFLVIEAIRGRPVSEKTEEKITEFFFILLLILMFLVTIKDIIHLF